MDSHKKVKDQMTAYLKDAVRAVQVENVETVEAIGSRDTTNAVCCAVEAIFLHGLKGSSTNKNFWPLVKKFTHKATLTQIMELSQISTDVGRCRAWIRLAINDCALDSYSKVVTDNTSTVRNYYDSNAYLRDVEQCNAMQTYLQGLCNFAFNLAFNSTVLNQWTTTTLVLSGLSSSGHLDWPMASAANEASSNKSALEVSFQRRDLNSPAMFGASSFPKSTSVPQDLSDIDSCLQLSQSEIDAIRSMSTVLRTMSETPVSMLSQPDFTENQPSIYNQLTFAITSDSDQESIDPERTDEQRDLRFERIVRSNLDRYPLDYDRNQTNSPNLANNNAKTVAANSGATSAKSGKEVNGSANGAKSNLTVSDCKPAIERSAIKKPETKSLNPFDDNDDDFDSGTANSNPFSDGSDHEVVTSGTRKEEGKEKSHLTEESAVNGLKSMDVNDDDDHDIKLSKEKTLVRKNCLKNKHSTRHKAEGTKENSGLKTNEDSNKLVESETSEVVADVVADDDFDDIYQPRARNEAQSFNSMLKTYVPEQTKIRNVDAIIGTLPKIEDSEETVQEDTMSSCWASSDATDTFDNSVDEKIDQQAQFLYQISIERGLNQQCYQCRNCSRAIGMFYDQDRVCAFDGYHYCNECHENKEHWIPAKVIFNWDFRPYKVSNISFEYLQRITETPVLDVERLNIKLYSHVKPLDNILNLRTQLRFAKSYLMTCTQSVATQFMEKFNHQSYLFENIHLYSLKDLAMVPNGTMQKRLQRIMKFATNHIYDCQRCCQKGFYCEICRAPKVIYPFETNSTYRCPNCKAVYHSHCKTHLVPCPKCKRLSEREATLQKSRTDPIDSVDYSFRRENNPSSLTAS